MRTDIRNILQIIIFIALVLFASCNNEMKFDKAKWDEQPNLDFTPPYRKKMLKDLTTHYKLTGLKYSEIINLLGAPNFQDNTSASFGYDIIIDYGSDIDPVYTQTLDFTFSKDSIITSYKVNEWKK
jgi:hypothetical protein